MKTRLFKVVGGLAALAMVAAGCASEDASGSDSEYHVLVLGGISAEGVLADNASTSVLSAKAGVDLVNKNGGIDGKKVTIKVVDDQADPTTAVTKLREAIAKEKPDLVLNSGPSTVADATLPILKQNNILSFNIGPTATSADPKAFPLNFDLSASAQNQLDAFPPYFAEKGYKKVGILHGSSSYGEVYGAAAEKTFTAAGVDVVANEEYDVAALDMTAQLEAIRSKSPDALVLDAYGAPLGYVLKGVEKLGWDIPIIGNTSVAATGLISTPPPSGVLGTPSVKNLVMQVYKSTAHDDAATDVNDLVTRMKAIDPIKATLIVAYNNDALALVQAAAEKAKSTDPKKLAEALIDSSVLEGATTAIIDTYRFTADSHAANPSADEFAFIAPGPLKDGQFQ
ncbi:ABC transporter substrate-binding protein [Nocardioides ginsengisoli]|uniref:ABC transporter substrate-binding protein n=1 Tax=Nocardioides ginsengisoli TaxID=363868 RepID=A0ABW3W4R4_9ACTN